MLALIALFVPIALTQEFTVSPQIKEVSGAAWDAQRGVVWSIGDSGNGPKLGLTQMQGWQTQALEVQDAVNEDWEAITLSDAGDLWILDIGDNEKKRPTISAYAIDADEAALGLARAHRKIEWTYPSGPMDVEAGVARESEIFLFEKTMTGRTRIHSIDISPAAPPRQLARLRATINRTGPITDACFDPSGKLFLLTYFGILSCEGCLEGKSSKTEKAGFWGQAETLIALGNGRFLIADESGRFRNP